MTKFAGLVKESNHLMEAKHLSGSFFDPKDKTCTGHVVEGGLIAECLSY